ncbi:flagellar hook-associated protein 2 [Lysinibacillus mangiferihumi]|uniref:Flagellar hook-associated protein 2 n=1 Tax=Lysinibacillus mangiferihumi TaxID=1130819 RepID=A0A4U2ZEK8_9BACI|nr:flagellar filament capping protein FliD [Lysinibacillus mangiferihumi]TKI72834.1 flagellar hook-associated protein 2 [Lysinibacillus mangiferihumi]
MAMRVGGLASGMDIDALVEKLMKAEKAPLNKLLQNKQKYEWQRDAYRDVNTKLKTFDTYIADNLVLKNLNSKAASSSNSDLVSVVATGKATGTLSIEGVSQLAEAARITSGQINGTNSTKMSDLVGSDTKFIEFKAPKADGSKPEGIQIAITSDMSVDDFVSKVNESNAGVSAVFENGHFSFTAKNTGKGDIEIKGIDGSGANTNISDLKLEGGNGAIKNSGKNAIFQVNGIATERNSNSFTINGYSITLKSTFNGKAASQGVVDIAQQSVNTATTKLQDLINKAALEYSVDLNGITNLSDQLNAVNAKLTQVISANQTSVDNAKAQLETASGTEIALKLQNADAQNFFDSLTKEQRIALSEMDLSATDLDLTTLNLSTEQLDKFNALSEDGKNELNALTKADVTKTAGTVYNALSETTRSAISSGTSLTDILDNPDLSDKDRDLLKNLSNDEFTALVDVDAKTKVYSNTLSELVKAQSHQVNLTNADNELQKAQKGLEDAKAANDAIPNDPSSVTVPAVTLSSTTNVDDIMKKIREFVDTYNGLIKDLNAQTKQAKYRDYAPLTEEQKKDMKEGEIKLWEEKAKSGLLRSDSLLRDGLSNMRSLVYESVPGLEDSKFNSLFSIGITSTKSYNDGGTLEINEDKLRKALEEDPDAVTRIFKNDGGKAKDIVDGKVVETRGYLARLRGTMDEFKVSIEQKAGRATLTDQQYTIGKNIIDTEKRISTWQDKLKDIESRYWRQFTAMEKAINKANSQSSLFSQG